jgi:hypothetical protein
VAGKGPVLVLIGVDPRTSPRATEALRIGLGIVAGQTATTFVLTGPAAHLLDADTDDLVDGDDTARFRESLVELDVPFHVETSAVPPGAGWNPDGARVVPVTPEAIADLLRGAHRTLVFA